jgi:2,3-bisphosphoglycerate-independent phosphoglycerate mutase
MGIIIFFVDGIGIGQQDVIHNPCLNSKYQLFSPLKKLPFNGNSFSLDACLGIKGLPQSATGQSTIYTGENTAKLIGKHLFGFPNEKIKQLLIKQSIFIELKSLGYCCKFMNAFRPIFFTSPEIFKDVRLSVTSEMNRAAGLSFSNIKDIKNRNALYHDFTNRELIEKGFQLPLFGFNDASKILIEQSKKNDLILYEYFLTDMAGHSKNMNNAISELNKIESLIYATVKKTDQTDISIIVCSDHGNIEDLSTKSHTYNPAFFAVWTKMSIKKLSSLMDIYSLTINLVTKN